MTVEGRSLSLVTKMTVPVLMAGFGFTLAIAPMFTLLAVVLLLPGIVAWWADADPSKPRSRTILGFGVAGAFGPLQPYLRQGQFLEPATSLLTGMEAISIAWGAAAIGWVIGRTIELVLHWHLKRGASSAADLLRAERRRLELEWDLPPR